MSKAAYENYFGKAAPPGAFFGADVAYVQAYNSAGGLDHGVALGYWQDLVNWASFVSIRTSYGGSGDDGGQGLHYQVANEVGFEGKKGPYHFIYPGAGLNANYDNFMFRADPYLGVSSFTMLDYEVTPVVGGDWLSTFCEKVIAATGLPNSLYSGKSLFDACNPLRCMSNELWVAHYAGRSADAWNPTTDWNSNGAPLMPNQYGPVYPGCWQWQSYTPEHGHLDLDMTTTPSQFGLGEDTDDMSAEAERQIAEIYTQLVNNNNFYNTVNNAADNNAKLNIMLPQLDSLFHHVTDGDRLLQMYNFTYKASEVQLPKVIALLEAMGVGGGTVNYDKIRQIVKEEVDARLDQVNFKN